MPLYRKTFERFNYGVVPHLTESLDVLLETDIPFDDKHRAAFDSAFRDACVSQNPHWQNYAAPLGSVSGWSSIISSPDATLIDDDANISFAWHPSLEGWLAPDGATMTLDIESAGQFRREQIIALQHQHTGIWPTNIQPVLRSDLFESDGAPRRIGTLQLRYDDFVLWGDGPRATSPVTIEVATVNICGRPLDFELPKATATRTPRVYERVRTWGWRFSYDGVGGESWRIASTKEDAVAQATQSAIDAMRSSCRHCCAAMLAVKHRTFETDGVLRHRSQTPASIERP